MDEEVALENGHHQQQKYEVKADTFRMVDDSKQEILIAKINNNEERRQCRVDVHRKSNGE